MPRLFVKTASGFVPFGFGTAVSVHAGLSGNTADDHIAYVRNLSGGGRVITDQLDATALPSTPAAGDEIRITDRAYSKYIYTGAKWLSEVEYPMYFGDDTFEPVGSISLWRHRKQTNTNHKWNTVPGPFTVTQIVIANQRNVAPDATQKVEFKWRGFATPNTLFHTSNWDGAKAQITTSGLDYDIAADTGLSAQYIFSATGTVPNSPHAAVYFRLRKV